MPVYLSIILSFEEGIMLGSSFMYPVFGFVGFKGWLLSTSLLELLSTEYQKQLTFTVWQVYKAKSFMHITLSLPAISLQNRYYYYQVYFISFEKLSDISMVTKLVEQGLNVGLLFLSCIASFVG